MQSARTSRTPAQLFALAFGGIYVLVGLVGFAVTGFGNFASDTSTRLLIFDINPLHNLVHLAIGAALLFGASRAVTASRVNLTIGAAYLAVAAVGLTGALGFLSINSGAVPDFFLHLASGVALVAFARGWARMEARHAGHAKPAPSAR